MSIHVQVEREEFGHHWQPRSANLLHKLFFCFWILIISLGRERKMFDNGNGDFLRSTMAGSSYPSGSFTVSSPPSTAVAPGVNGGLNYIVHHVSKFDTLAGVAIKYGVEVADIERLNGLVTDLQMFALKTLQIPLPGRHPPSPILSIANDSFHCPNSSYHTPSSFSHSDLLNSFQSLKLNSSSAQKVTDAASCLHGYYGLRSKNRKDPAEGFEMTVYQNGGAHYLEDLEFSKSSSLSNPPLSHHRKAKSVANFFFSEKDCLIGQILSQEADDSDSDCCIEKLIERRQKSEADFTCRTPEKLLKKENTSGCAISAITGKRLALRSKSANRTAPGVDGEAGGPNAIPYGSSDSLFPDTVTGFRKSSSTSSLQESDSSTFASIWPTSKWSLKPDFQALSTSAIVRPIFDGLPKPMGRRNKAALD